VIGLLSKLFGTAGNDLQLTRPDFTRFGHIELDFSGTKLRFKDAAHTAMYPINDWPEDMDIYSPNDLELQEKGHYAQRFYVRGWDFLGKKNRAKGGCSIDSTILYFPDKYPEAVSCFTRNIFEQEILEYCHRAWGGMNPGSSLGSLGPEGDYVYPVDASSLSYTTINGMQWCRFTAQRKADPPAILYACPISKHHIIINEFTLEAYGSLDFFSPETNLEQTCYDVVDDYMSEFYIELSPRAKAEKAEATDPV
jgi:hypothetical protein